MKTRQLKVGLVILLVFLVSFMFYKCGGPNQDPNDIRRDYEGCVVMSAHFGFDNLDDNHLLLCNLKTKEISKVPVDICYVGIYNKGDTIR